MDSGGDLEKEQRMTQREKMMKFIMDRRGVLKRARQITEFFLAMRIRRILRFIKPFMKKFLREVFESTRPVRHRVDAVALRHSRRSTVSMLKRPAGE